MASPAILGDPAYPILALEPLNTATGRFYVKNSGTDTGTVVTTSRAIDFARKLHETGVTTGLKPLDATVHPRLPAMPAFRSLALSIGLKMQFHDSGRQVFIEVAHKTRAATSGAGSSWQTLRTTVHRFKMGTDTDAIANKALISGCNAQALQRFYKANITVRFRLNSSTGAKDTTTSQGGFTLYNPVLLALGAPVPQFVPAIVS